MVTDVHGRERCRTSLCEGARREGRLNKSYCPVNIAKRIVLGQQGLLRESHGTYFHYFTQLSGGESVIYNAGDDQQRLLDAVDLMCHDRPHVC